MRRSRVRSPSAPFPEQAKAAAARRTVLFCFLVALCEGLDLQAAGVAAGGLSREFMPTAGQKGLFFSASTFGLSIGAVIGGWLADRIGRDRKSTRLNSSHLVISYAVFCLKKKTHT